MKLLAEKICPIKPIQILLIHLKIYWQQDNKIRKDIILI